MEEKKFVFCSNCGEKLGVGSKFCTSCGTPMKNNTSTNEETMTTPPIQSQHIKEDEVKKEQYSTERKTVFDGVVHKCPQCGEVINSFVSICPACGFELSGKTVSSSLQEFINKINESENAILNSQQGSKSGWGSWSKSKRFWWVVLNVFFVCIPLVIYLVLPLVMIKSTPKLTKEEQYKASLIENFPFPNDRESVLAALVFAKEKIDFISKETIDRKTAYWMRLWCSKAEQLKQKAEMLFPNDTIVKQCYDEIVADESRVDKIIKIKAIVGLVVLAIAIIFMIVRYNGNVNITDDKDYNATFEWQTTGLFAELPVPDTNNGKIVMETDKQINIELYNITAEEFDAYVKKCRNEGFTTDVTKTDGVFYATDENGYDLNLFYDSIKDVLSIHISAYDLSDISNNAEGIDKPTTEQKIVKNFVFSIPDYWEEEGSKNDYLQYYAEKGDKVVMLSIAYPEESDDNYEVSFEGLSKDSENMKIAVGGMFTDGDVISDEVFESKNGVKGMLYQFTYRQKISDSQQVDGSGYCFCFPSTKDRRWFYVTLLHTNNISSNQYKADFMDLISALKEKS